MCKKLTTEEFINRAKKIHGDKYDYSLVEYFSLTKHVNIICPIHGVFKQRPSNHLVGCGCNICGKEKNYIKRRLTKEEFVKKANSKHFEKYDYTLVNYTTSNKKVQIICPIHGIFEMTPNNHISGKGCQKCAKNYRFKNNEIIERFRNIHGNKYDYSLVNYKNAHTCVKIICPIHGAFYQSPNNHFKGQGCEMCAGSLGENKIIKYLTENNVEFIHQKKFKDCKMKKKLSFDFYLPKLNICIEFNGKQHYESIKWFGGTKSLKLQKTRDKIKKEYCKTKKISLLIVKYNEDILKKLIEYKIIPK